MFTSAIQRLRFMLYLAALVIVPASIGTNAEAGPAFCGNHTMIASNLDRRYGEIRRMMGISDNGKAVVEIYASKKRTFTVLLTIGPGKTCVMMTGQAFEIIEEGEPI